MEEYLVSSSLDIYVRELISWCREESEKLEKHQARYPSVAATTETVQEKLRVPWHKLDVLTKYQTTLDNQLFKTLKNLRDAQEWRLKTIDAVNDDVEEIHANVA